MQLQLLDFLRCPVTRTPFTIKIIKKSFKNLNNINTEIIEEGILFSENDFWIYPIIKGIPRLTIEAFIDYEYFFKINILNYEEIKKNIFDTSADFINFILKKNKKTKKSFSFEWKIFDYEKDNTWGMDGNNLVARFCEETNETIDNLKTKTIFDAGCGNAKLNILLANLGIVNIAMDFSKSIESAYCFNNSKNVHFIQGDVQFPPVAFNCFDVVHSSGVLIHTNNTELSFSCLEPTVKKGGKLSVWLYHPRNNWIHNFFNILRNYTSKLPLKIQYFLYKTTIFPASFIIKKLKGNKQNSREMMVDILDWFSPEFRWEHSHSEVKGWYLKRNYKNIKVTTSDMFGFDIVGVKN